MTHFFWGGGPYRIVPHVTQLPSETLVVSSNVFHKLGLQKYNIRYNAL